MVENYYLTSSGETGLTCQTKLMSETKEAKK